MKSWVKKCIGYTLIFGFTMPSFGYQWTIYNGLGEDALIQTNVSAQVMRQVIPAGQNVVFNYNTWAGAGNILWCGGLCLTTIYAQPMSATTMQPAHLKIISGSQLKGILVTSGITGAYAIPALLTMLANPDMAIGALIAGAILAIIAAAIILPKLCNNGSWIIVKDKAGIMHSITVKT